MTIKSLCCLLICAFICSCSGVVSDPMPNANENTNPPPATGVTITYLHNAGVMISDGTRKVLIDALIDEFSAPPQAAGPNSAWIQLDATELDKLNNAQAPYDGADLILITHDHGDHYSSTAVNSHVSNNATVRVIGPPQVTGGAADLAELLGDWGVC